MSGNHESAQELLARINKALDEYETKQGLPVGQPHREAERYLNINHKELSKMSPEECGEAAVVLAQYAFHLQRSYNAELSRINWSADNVSRTISDEIQQYRASSLEERRQLAIRGNEYASKLDQIRTWAQARADRLSYLSSRVEFLAKSMMELQQTKRRYKNGE
jgi:hypothetical protein